MPNSRSLEKVVRKRNFLKSPKTIGKHFKIEGGERREIKTKQIEISPGRFKRVKFLK